MASGKVKFNVSKADKENRVKISRDLTFDDIVKVCSLLSSGFSYRKIHYMLGYNLYFIRNTSKLYYFLHNHMTEDSLKAGLADKYALMSSLKLLISEYQEEAIELLMALIYPKK